MLRFLMFSVFALLLFSSLQCKDDVVNPPATTTEPVQYETPFAGVPATSDMVLYEINERAFSVSGDFAGIVPRLDSIKALGVNVIWLMPIHPIGVTNTVNSPYCITDYKGVNSEFGNLESLRTLVREAHNRGMSVILDWAANHTSWDNPWVSAHKAWYTQDASGNIIHPAGTNWQDVADLNFDNAEMRLEMIKALKYWVLVANLDGYRCDAADYVPFSFWQQAIDSLHLIPNRSLILLAEGSRADHFDAGFQMNFSWDFFNKSVDIFKDNQSASGFKQVHLSEYSTIPVGSHKLRFTSNHDKCAWEDTPLGFFGGKDGSMSAFVITAYFGGVPLIYNGQEVGCAVKLPFFSKSPINWTTNPDMFERYKLLMQIRAAHPALRTGDLTSFSGADVAAFRRSTSGDTVFVVANTRNTPIDFNVPSSLQNTTWHDEISGASVELGTQLGLGAFEYQVLSK